MLKHCNYSLRSSFSSLAFLYTGNVAWCIFFFSTVLIVVAHANQEARYRNIGNDVSSLTINRIVKNQHEITTGALNVDAEGRQNEIVQNIADELANVDEASRRQLQSVSSVDDGQLSSVPIMTSSGRKAPTFTETKPDAADGSDASQRFLQRSPTQPAIDRDFLNQLATSINSLQPPTSQTNPFQYSPVTLAQLQQQLSLQSQQNAFFYYFLQQLAAQSQQQLPPRDAEAPRERVGEMVLRKTFNTPAIFDRRRREEGRSRQVRSGSSIEATLTLPALLPPRRGSRSRPR